MSLQEGETLRWMILLYLLFPTDNTKMGFIPPTTCEMARKVTSPKQVEIEI